MSRTALLVGDFDADLQALLRDVLADLGIRALVLEDEATRLAQPTVVLVCLDARARADALGKASRHRAPVIVIVSSDDDALLDAVRRRGHRRVYRLGRPLAELQDLILECTSPVVHG